jgi:hypothetical protein
VAHKGDIPKMDSIVEAVYGHEGGLLLGFTGKCIGVFSPIPFAFVTALKAHADKTSDDE